MSRVIKRSVYHFVNTVPLHPGDLISSIHLNENGSYIYSKIPCDSSLMANCQMQFGFRIVDTNITLKCHSKNITEFPGKTPELKVKSDCVGNYFARARGDGMFYIEFNIEPARFLLYLDTPNSRVIDLICTCATQRGKGVATALIIKLAMLALEKKVLAATKAVNIPSMRQFKRIDFCLKFSQYIFYIHA